jgi:hypothetical protein
MGDKVSKINLGSPASIMVVVKDVEEFAAWATAMWGAGSWEIFEYSPNVEDMTIGEPFRVKIGMVKLNGITLELIEPMAGDTIWSKFLEEKGSGIINLTFNVSNWDETITKLQAEGNKMVAGAKWEGIHWCIFDPGPKGILFELVEEKS